jgi:integrase
MKNPVVVEAVKHPKCTHRVRFPGGDGKVRQKYFVNETAALAFAKKREKEIGVNGTDFGAITEDERAALARWRAFLATSPTTPPPLADAIAGLIAGWQASTGSVKIQMAMDQFIANQESEEASTRHVASLKSRIGRLATDHGDELVSSMDAGRFTDWLNGLRATRADKEGEKLTLTTRDNLKKSCRTFFAFCMGRGWLATNPVPIVRKKRNRADRLAKNKAPGIMLPEDIQRFLFEVKERAEKIIPFWCLKFFAGIRDSEAAAMNWSMIDLKAGKISLPASITKTGEPRDVKIEPVLAAWLKPYAKKSGEIAPTSSSRVFAYRKVLRYLRRPAQKGEAPREFDFPSNAARHSFGTYHLYHFRNAGETALQLGHKGDPAMLHEHYKNPKAEYYAPEFWEIMPPEKAAAPDNVVSIKKARRYA